MSSMDGFDRITEFIGPLQEYPLKIGPPNWAEIEKIIEEGKFSRYPLVYCVNQSVWKQMVAELGDRQRFSNLNL